MIARVAVSAGLCFAVGFEHEVRCASAGDRTFTIVGVSAAAVTAAVVTMAPNAIAGVLTGVGFIGGGLVPRADDQPDTDNHDATALMTKSSLTGVCR